MNALIFSISLALAQGGVPEQAVMPTEQMPMNAAPTPGVVELSEDAQRVVERKAGCAHFASEIGGDDSERDREVSQSMEDLDCKAIERDAAAMERKYPNDRTLRQLLRAAARN